MGAAHLAGAKPLHHHLLAPSLSAPWRPAASSSPTWALPPAKNGAAPGLLLTGAFLQAKAPNPMATTTLAATPPRSQASTTSRCSTKCRGCISLWWPTASLCFFHGSSTTKANHALILSSEQASMPTKCLVKSGSKAAALRLSSPSMPKLQSRHFP